MLWTPLLLLADFLVQVTQQSEGWLDLVWVPTRRPPFGPPNRAKQPFNKPGLQIDLQPRNCSAYFKLAPKAEDKYDIPHGPHISLIKVEAALCPPAALWNTHPTSPE